MIGEIRQNFTEASASVGLILATALRLVKNTSTLNFTSTVHKLRQIKTNTTTLHKLHNTKSFILYFDSYHVLITRDVIISLPSKCFGDGMEGKMRKNFLFSPPPLPSCLFFALTPTLLMNSCAGYVIMNTKNC